MRADPFPERRAGGFTRIDGTVQFYTRVQALCEEMEAPVLVVDLGAGRGVSATNPVGMLRRVTDLRSPDRRLVGLDVDPAVLENPLVDEAHVIEAGGRLPLDDASVDLLVSDWTFEHVADPSAFAAETARVVKPGGWLCARTPNKWGVIGIAGRSVPNARHVKVLERLQPDRKDIDVFPTVYRLNTMRDLREHFRADQWDNMTYSWDPEMSYGGHLPSVQRAAKALSRVTPASMRAVWLVFLRRR